MPLTPSSAAKKQRITLAQMSSYDDILTDALVDHAYYWTTIPKNRISYHPSRGVKEEEITKIIQSHLVVEPNVELAESKLLTTDGLGKFYGSLKTSKEKDDFRAHLRRYMRIYLPDCPFEVSSTNRYTIMSHEAAVVARKFVKRGQPIKYLSGIQVMITDKEDKELSKRKKDFSIVVSSRNKCAALFMGPARFANHDCGANARLMITGQSGIEIVATQNIEAGDEITVSYAENYFGEDNCECLCKTCEDNVSNGWAQPGDTPVVKKSIEEPAPEGYSLRQRRRDDSCASSSRTPSITPTIRPRVRKSKSTNLRVGSERAPVVASPTTDEILGHKRKLDVDFLRTPPITPAKRLKTLQYEVQPIHAPRSLSRRPSPDSSLSAYSSPHSESTELALTDVTTPDEDLKASVMCSPASTPRKEETSPMKREESEISSLPEIAFLPSFPESQDRPTARMQVTPGSATSLGSLADNSIENLPSLDSISLTPPVVPASIEHLETLPVEETANPVTENKSSQNPSRGRGRPRKGSVTSEADVITVRKRVPGDYSLTPKLLSEPSMAWIQCMNCSEAFVQQNAYYTRSSCPRCERHSKLYGYLWPKTEKEGPHDKEERILDHRTIHRFLDADNEAKVRGRKPPSAYVNSAQTIPVVTVPSGGKRGPGRPRKYAISQPLPDPDDDYEDDSVRRSNRRRHPSLKVVGC